MQPTIAWKISDKVSVGFGPTFNRIDGQLKNTLATNGLLGSNGDTKINIKGDDTAIGYNVGVMVDLTDDTTWGLTYHSQGQVPPGQQHRSEERSGCPGPERQVTMPSWTSPLPESVDTSITHKFDDKWTGYLGAASGPAGAAWRRSRCATAAYRRSARALGFNYASAKT